MLIQGDGHFGEFKEQICRYIGKNESYVHVLVIIDIWMLYMFLGYNIELVVKHEDVQRLMDFVRKQLPGGKSANFQVVIL